jgi:hypothetical protein
MRGVALAAPTAFQDLGALVFGHHALHLKQQIVLWRQADCPVEKDDLHPEALELIDHQDLIGITAGQAIGGMDVDPIDGPGGHPIPQTFESRTDEGGAAVALINKTVVWFEMKPVLYNLRFQSRHLTGNGSLLGLLFRGDTSVEGNTECRHAH